MEINSEKLAFFECKMTAIIGLCEIFRLITAVIMLVISKERLSRSLGYINISY